MKTYSVPIFFEERVLVTIKAETQEQAEEQAENLAYDYGGTDYPKEYKQDFDYRNWSIQNTYIEEVQDEN
jgi:hypothetical protein